MAINQKHTKALELDKILERLAGHTSCEDARDLALRLKPATDFDEAQHLLEQTEAAHMLLARFGGPAFGGLKNVNNALRRAQAGSVLQMRELLEIAQVLRTVRGIVNWHSTCAGVETCLDVIFDALMPNKYLEESITSAIVSEDEMADNASQTLAEIRRKIRRQEAKVREQLERLTRSSTYSKYLQDHIITMRNGRFVVPVKSEHRSEIAGLVHDASSSGATVFIEPTAVVEANNEVKVLQGKEKEEIDRILAALSTEAGTFCDSIEMSYEAALELNLIFAKAQLGYQMKAAVPKLNDEGIIVLHKARHPLIDPKKVVPIDIHLGDTFDTLVITGPNTGGKTVSIKTLGLLSLMAMCGLMLPVGDESTVSVFDSVLADIGDEQSIEQSLSTFSAHMTNIISILEQANDRSLVLIDELGAGTDPVEGAALAMAVLEALHEQGAKIASTTHYAELKAYALQSPRVENGCCEFDVASLRPTYRLLLGVPGRSNAFAISKRLGMSDAVVARAQALVSSENIRFEDVVDRLEESRQKAEQEAEQAREIAAKAQAEVEKAKALRAEAAALRDKELEQAKSQAMKITEQAKRQAYALLEELDKLKKEQAKAKDAAELARRARASVKKSIQEMDEVADPVVRSQLLDEDYTLPRPLQIGDRVLLADLGSEASVVALPDKKNMVEVQVGTMRTRTKLDNLRLIGAKAVKKSTPGRRVPSGVESRMTSAAETRVDLRGMTVDECILTLDRFMDSALRTGLSEFTIVHGKGTGALRSAVQNYLKGCSFVKSYRLGVYGEGENGVTIVVLK